MYLYVLQLFDIDYRDDILLAMTSAGIKKATVVEGTNFDKILEQEFPLFTGLFRGPDDRARFSHLVFGTVEGVDVLQGLVDVLTQAGIDNKKEEIYRLLVLEGRRLG
jgi:hypothetical protein